VAGSVTSAVAVLTVTTAILTPQPLPSAAYVQTDGFPLSIALEVGRNYRIEVSTNLRNWATITNFTSTTGALQFLDMQATNSVRRFYRVVSP
jgi:hypothetical protein